MRSWIKIISACAFSLVLCISCIGFSHENEKEADNDTGQTPGAEESNANLSALSISVGALRFDPDIATYNVEVDNTVATLTCTANVANQQASLKINDEPADSGEPFGPIDLAMGQNTILILVTALDVTKTYTVVVTRLEGISHNADLSGLVLSQGTLTPAFNANTLAYTAEVPNTVSSLAVTPTAAGVHASIIVNGSAVASGAASASIALTVGVNAIDIVITAEDGTTTKTYIVQVTKLTAPSTNANLSGLTISQGTLTPTFLPATLYYTTQVTHAIETLTVTPTAAGTNATITVNGAAVVSGNPAQAVDLIVGDTTIAVMVTAEDGLTSKRYTIVATRLEAPSLNADLSNLTISQGVLSLAFNPATHAYTAQVPHAVSSLTVTPTAAGVGAHISVNGGAVVSGAQSPAISLNVGTNTITIMVTAQDEVTTASYTIVVTRLEAPSTNADLSNLAISAGTLDPVFDTSTLVYEAEVPHTVSSLTVTPTAAGVGAIITVNGGDVVSGTQSPAQDLNVGSNTITMMVTAQDDVTTKTYTVDVDRLEAPSTNADLSNLTISEGTLTPVFDVNTLDYTAEVPNALSSLTVTPTAAGVNASITVNGSTVASGAASASIGLAEGVTAIDIVITAEDGTTTRTYTVLVTRLAALSTNADLSALTISQGTLSPDFVPVTLDYTAQVANDIETLTVTPAAAGTNATITVNDEAVVSGYPSQAVDLIVGDTSISVMVTAEDGATTKTYTIVVSRAQNIFWPLLSLAIDN